MSVPSDSTLKNLPAMETRETRVLSLGREDPLEEEMATTPVFLPGKSHGQRSLVGYSPERIVESDTTKPLSTVQSIHIHAKAAHCV